MAAPPPRRLLLGIGALFEDTILTVPRHPAEDSKLRAVSRTTRVGGNIVNMFEVLADSPMSVERAFCGAVGSRDSCQWIKRHLENQGVRCELLFREDACARGPATATVICALDTGSRTIISCGNGIEEPSGQELLDTLPPETIKPHWMHIEARNCHAVHRFLKAHLLGRGETPPRISVDMEKPRDGQELLIRHADVVFVSHSYSLDLVDSLGPAAAATKDSNPLALMRLLCGHLARMGMPDNAIVYYTLGGKGSMVLWMDNWGPEHKYTALKPRPGAESGRFPGIENFWNYVWVDVVAIEKGKVVETVGAGDAFQSGVLHTLLEVPSPSPSTPSSDCHRHWIRAAQVGSQIAAAKIQQRGFRGLWKNPERWFDA